MPSPIALRELTPKERAELKEPARSRTEYARLVERGGPSPHRVRPDVHQIPRRWLETQRNIPWMFRTRMSS